jgi:hypothetical protein
MDDMPEVIGRKRALTQELDGQIAYSENKAICNHWISLILMLVALGCSVTAAIIGIFLSVSSKIVGGIALLPPLIAYGVVNMKFDGKSSWHYRKSKMLSSLRSRLLYQQPEAPTVDNIAAIARERDELDLKMQAEWDKTLVFNWSGMSNRQDGGSSGSQTPSGQ